jgi:class 3 adenylate cyclase
VEEFNAGCSAYPALSVGIGIHTAMMVAIGEETRIQGDAFSDTVNLTARIEGLNKFYGTSMIISEDTRQQIGSRASAYKMRFLGKVIVKGRLAPLGLYEVYHGLGLEVVQKREAGRGDFERGIALYSQGSPRRPGSLPAAWPPTPAINR